MIFEKIRERLREWDKYSQDGLISVMGVMNIINQVEAEYNNGWIPCSERLPEDANAVFATCVNSKGSYYTDIARYIDDEWCHFSCSTRFQVAKVIAWMPLPEPYKKRE